MKKAIGLNYLVLNKPSDKALAKVLSILPSKRSPTVIKLVKKDKCAVQTIVKRGAQADEYPPIGRSDAIYYLRPT